MFRGMKNLQVASEFLERGGTELATMSTTSDLKVAVMYSLSPKSLLLKIKTTSFMQRGAEISYLSAFPHEAEFVYPPLTYLRPTGRTMEYEVDDGTMHIVIVEVEPQL